MLFNRLTKARTHEAEAPKIVKIRYVETHSGTLFLLGDLFVHNPEQYLYSVRVCDNAICLSTNSYLSMSSKAEIVETTESEEQETLLYYKFLGSPQYTEIVKNVHDISGLLKRRSDLFQPVL